MDATDDDGKEPYSPLLSDAPHAAAAVDDIIFSYSSVGADDSVVLYYFILDR